MKSIDSGVCHRLWSIFWWNVRACLLTIKYQVVQFLPNKHFRTIWEHCTWQFSNRFCCFFLEVVVIDAWSRYFVAESSCLPTHNIVPHTSLHDQPYHKTMKKYEDFERMVISPLHPRKLAIRTWFCNCPQYLCLFRIVVECIPSNHDPGKMLVLPNRLLYWVVSTSGSIFCFSSSQFYVIHIHR